MLGETGGNFNIHQQIIDYLIDRDPVIFVKSFAEGLHQAEVANLLLSILWLLSPSPAKSKSDGPPSGIIMIPRLYSFGSCLMPESSFADMRKLAAESFNQWLSGGELVPTVIQVLADSQAPEVGTTRLLPLGSFWR